MCAWGTRRGRGVTGWHLAARVAAQSSDSIEQLAAVPERGNAKLLQVLRRQARKNRFVNLILSERSLILPRPRLRSQTTMSMMAPELYLGAYHYNERAALRVAREPEGPARIAIGVG